MPRTEPIPQPKGDPLIGNLRAVDGDAPMQGFMRLARIHGPIFQLDFFGKAADPRQLAGAGRTSCATRPASTSASTRR